MPQCLREKVNQWMKVSVVVLISSSCFQFLFKEIDYFLNIFRFGQPSTYFQKMLQCYLIFYLLFISVSTLIKIKFDLHMMYQYLALTLFSKYIYAYLFHSLLNTVKQKTCQKLKQLWTIFQKEKTNITLIVMSFALLVSVTILILLRQSPKSTRKYQLSKAQ